MRVKREGISEAIDAIQCGRHLIDGSWKDDSSEYLEVRSPSTGTVIGHTPLGSSKDIDDAVAAAAKALDATRSLSLADRGAFCRRVASEIERRKETLAQLLTLEQGKPLYQSMGELDMSVLALNMAADQISCMAPTTVTTLDPQKKAFVELRPRGVYGIITPWNFPVMVPIGYYLAPGLAAGNAIVWVPAPSTSLIAAKLGECFMDADPPAPGAVNIVHGEGAVVGESLVKHDRVDAIGFTGSTATGRRVASNAGLKPTALELGGNGPSIVLEDADVDRAAERTALGAFTNAGQICTSTERVLVHHSIYDRYVDAVVKEAARTKLGDPFDPATTLGPLHNKSTAAKVDEHLKDASQGGGVFAAGGGRAEGFSTDLYYQATVIAGPSPESLLNCEETFGPVVPVLSFRDEAHLQDLVSRSNYGLFAAVFSKSVEKAMRIGNGLKIGVVNINDTSAYWEPGIPGGGASGTLSGSGRIGVGPSINAMSDQVTVTIDLAS